MPARKARSAETPAPEGGPAPQGEPRFEPVEDRVPPHLVEAEEAVLGGVLLDPDAISRVASILAPEAFYVGPHQAIWKAVVSLHSQGKATDVVNVEAWLADLGQLERVGGRVRLIDLVDKVISTASIEAAARLVADKHTRRKLIAITNSITSLAFDQSKPINEVLGESEQRIFSISQQAGPGGLEWGAEIVADVFDDLINLAGTRAQPGVQAGFYDLDEMTQGFGRSDLIILAGRPAMGKTAIVLNIAKSVAETQDLPVAIFSMEMSKSQLVQRLLSMETGIQSAKLRPGKLSREEWAMLGMGVSNFCKLPIAINDKSNTSALEMRSQCRRIMAETGKQLGLVIIDYLQLMDGKGSDNRVQELSRITRALKGMAKELNVPVIALSQLSRAVEARTNKRPLLSDLRESGSIEQDADLVMMLYRDEYYNPETPDRGITELIVAKHRNGPVGTCRLLFEPQYTRFRNVAYSG